ncbi:ITGB1 [Acanthosepion pharaonis]|uniref:Integrin beta n=1 Tax=Acanthosepion pharaonis TaxID=158019 RepID=A0A812DIR6_ACAPH|nr:ITGB1 [Sepia pharaonis]
MPFRKNNWVLTASLFLDIPVSLSLHDVSLSHHDVSLSLPLHDVSPPLSPQPPPSLFPEAVTDLETCSMQTNCRSCITFSQNCSWCDQNPYNEYRCDLKENHLANGCKNINNPKYQLDFVKNEETADGGESGKAIQMKPQEILLRIRPLNSIKMLTGTLHVGIGSFIDKVLLPYTDTSFQGIQNPCRSANPPFQCMKTYNFKQIMKLTSSITDFTDYPSVGHIAQMLQKNKVTVVFAVAGDTKVTLYKKLAESLEGAYVSKLDSKQYTIADIVRTSYKVNFTAVITGPACSQDPSANFRQITISPVGLNEKLLIKLELICECPCEEQSKVVPKSPLCNGNGTLTCGLCICDPGYSGKTCECSTQDVTSKLSENCRPDNQSAECSNNQMCQSNAVNLKRTYSGAYCECDDFSCPNFNKMLCGGPTRGVCKCGKCICHPEYTGTNCNCPTSYTTCLTKNGYLSAKSDCTKEIDIKMLIAGIVGGIFFIGILILVIWKLVVRYYDKREMARFNEDREKAKWTQQSNPIYEPASTTFKNPTHGLET